jgi:hypothetical protein
MEDGVDAEADRSISEKASRRASVSKARIVNAINYLHSQDRPVYVVFRHVQYNTAETVEALPFPCYEDYLHLSWNNQRKLKDRMSSYEFDQVLVESGRSVFSLKPQVVTIDDKNMCFDIGQLVGTDGTQRMAERWSCHEIDIEMIQNGISFKGTLRDCSGVSFSAVMSCGSLPSFTYVNQEHGVTVLLKKQEELIYSGECRIIRVDGSTRGKTFALEPSMHTLHRFKQKMHRSPRHRLSPSPNIVFTHPLTGKTVSRRIEELAGSGFSVIEHYESCTLIPGMMLPQAEIEFAYGVSVSCRAQVMTRSTVEEAASAPDCAALVRFGVAILDMELSDQTLIASMLHRATDKNSYVCNRVDIDELVKFFFETGFIYPKKYLSLYSNIAGFRELYKKLYMECPEIARHFIYRDNGRIKGHISMLRFFEKTWLFHHHAAIGSSKAGLVVLDQIGRFVNDVFNMYSSHMRYVLCYFRPENRFPDRIFGGYARHLANPKLCSLDDFAHVVFRKNQSIPPLPSSFTLEPSGMSDIFEFNDYYFSTSGGLITAAFELRSGDSLNIPIKDI